MSDIAIKVENLSKLYRIGMRERKHETFIGALASWVTAPFTNYRRLRKLTHFDTSSSGRLLPAGGRQSAVLQDDLVWALKGASFEVKRGEVVGIIGRNGAGKSTLLKILSRITEPTSGRAFINGRVASLLEVGTGFHGELTGRENIYLNGTILGMTKKEVDRKFDEIVDFADVDKFIDTPVKHYSSGMYVRLAFAVAAHLEPEILLVDEVLAVGDASFQKKCLNKMEAVGEQGRTVFFVSHNMPAVTRLCPRTILLDKGRMLKDGPSHQVVSTYLSTGLGTTGERDWPDPESAPGNDIVRLRAVRVREHTGKIVDAIDIRRLVKIEMEFQVLKPGFVLVPNFHFFNEEGVCAFIASDHDPHWHQRPRPAGRYVSTALIPGNLLAEGSMIVNAAVSTMNPVTVHFSQRDAVAFQVIDSLDGDSARGDYAGSLPGIVRPLLKWETQFDPTRNASRSDLPKEGIV